MKAQVQELYDSDDNNQTEVRKSRNSSRTSKQLKKGRKTTAADDNSPS
jgi:hypothetical protein